MVSRAIAERWPELPYAAWKDTRDTLHLWTQVVGKVRLALTPWLNHSWHVVLYVTARGLTTSPIPWRGGSFQIDFDFIDHVLWVQDQRRPFSPDHAQADERGGILRLADDRAARTRHRCAHHDHAVRNRRLHSVRAGHACTRPTMPTMPTASGACCCAANEVFAHFRTGFLGKASPVHFFWGSFDLAVTRFSGRRAPRHPGGVPHLPDAVAQEAYSHEVSSAGFWPGGGGPIDYAAFYSYAYPAPDGFAAAGAAGGGVLHARSSANSCCLTMPCAPRAIRTRR